MKKDVLFSSLSQEWATPPELFQQLNREFSFTLDPCASAQNAKCRFFYTAEEDGLLQDWGGERVFCNPPYGRGVGKWVEKCFRESAKPGTLVVMLLPARTDTAWFHRFIYHHAEVRFIRGRLKFGNSTNAAPFPSMVVIYRPI